MFFRNMTQAYRKISSTVSDPAPSVLVVDDHALDRKLLTAYLTPEGYSIETASDGVEAWGKLNDDPERSDVVVLDRTMQRMAGIELVTQQNDKTRPRIVLV